MPCLFSMQPSIKNWKMEGVVKLLMVIVLFLTSSTGNLAMNWFTVTVLAVPGRPTSRVGLFSA